MKSGEHMDYFRLRQDPRRPYGILLKGLIQMSNGIQAAHGDVGGLDKMTVAFVSTGSKLNWYPDVFDKQIFMVRKHIKKSFDLVAPKMEYRYFCVLDNDNDRHEYYYAPVLPQVSCYSKASEANLDTSVVRHLALRKGEIPPFMDIFRVSGVKDKVVVVSLAMAECLMRRRTDGILLSPIDLVDL